MEVLFKSRSANKTEKPNQCKVLTYIILSYNYLVNLETFILALIEIGKKNYSWMNKQKAFNSLVKRYLV